jgi:hypothetical protein
VSVGFHYGLRWVWLGVMGYLSPFAELLSSAVLSRNERSRR